jgi:serine/threonine protein kinase
MNATDWQHVPLDEDLEAKYEILAVLGGGGMGRVLRARHRQLKRMVAIKLLNHDLKASESVTRFLREARAAAQIRSTHVAHVMDAGLLRNGQPYIVMEYLQGQDLASLVATRGRLAIPLAVDFTLQALDALAEAHSLEIIHRDIKPGNLFATRLAGGDTAIKVVDFGLAKTGGSLDTLDPGVTERGAVLGTPSYMSPEQFVNAQDVDARADIWGIGATLFELLTGVPPFLGKTLPQIYTAVMHQPVLSIRSLLPELPEGLEQVVATCLTRERERRYANVAELAAALGPYAGEAASDRVARIRRVVDGVSDSADAIDLGTEGFSTLTDTGVARRGAISSMFARDAADGCAPRGSSRANSSRYQYSIGAGFVALLLAGCLFWLLGANRNHLGSAPDLPLSGSRSPKRESEPPRAAAAPAAPDVTQATALAPPPAAAPVAHPTANRPRRARTNKTVAADPPNVDIYEQYP